MILIENDIKTRCPQLQLGILTCKVQVEKSSDTLSRFFESQLNEIQNKLSIPQISQLPIAQQTRRGYKATGKDPARYRPSAEALLRRVVQGKGLYAINNVVDCLNYISVKTAFSIGGYDSDAIIGIPHLGIGKAGEAYKGIGRGDLNIEGLAVLRDDIGAFGTPTSDSLRTCIQPLTQNFMMVFFNFEGSPLLKDALQLAANSYLEKLKVENLETNIIA